MTRRVSILIVPEMGQPRRFQIPVLWIKIGAGAVGLFLLLVVVSFFSYARLFTKAMERDQLVGENARLLQENRRILVLSQEVEQSKRSLERIIKSLGGKLDYKGPSDEAAP